MADYGQCRFEHKYGKDEKERVTATDFPLEG